MRLPHLCACLSLLAPLPAWAADSKSPAPLKPCTIYSATSGSFFDLNALSVQPPKEGKKAHKDDRTESWHAKGYDYQTNFTLNFCAPVVEDLDDVVGVDNDAWRNPPLRSLSPPPGNPVPLTPRTRPTNNLPTPSSAAANSSSTTRTAPPAPPPPTAPPPQRKSTLISFLCDRDPLAAKASIAFVGASPDACTYVFEVRSMAACGGVGAAQQTLGPGAVFGVIALIAVAVYLVGGCVYQRNVMHQRGWRQLPNYAIWAGVGAFVRDVFIIATSACARLVPRRRGYSQLSGGRGRSSDDENRLIDQLDEDWDD
ncbi:MAG: hypothetical protein FRX48_08150 [Lasallia pustulata]|uniref:MRH domain-containing protein n=1 Tax=Lasallia pustulata TaxID=136370 RepID=A0A5M8PEM0_9LECA|nr:MAG: hypothetical protein FRX48_08150 [Lasallia pustulata]